MATLPRSSLFVAFLLAVAVVIASTPAAVSAVRDVRAHAHAHQHHSTRAARGIGVEQAFANKFLVYSQHKASQTLSFMKRVTSNACATAKCLNEGGLFRDRTTFNDKFGYAADNAASCKNDEAPALESAGKRFDERRKACIETYVVQRPDDDSVDSVDADDSGDDDTGTDDVHEQCDQMLFVCSRRSTSFTRSKLSFRSYAPVKMSEFNGAHEATNNAEQKCTCVVQELTRSEIETRALSDARAGKPLYQSPSFSHNISWQGCLEIAVPIPNAPNVFLTFGFQTSCESEADGTDLTLSVSVMAGVKFAVGVNFVITVTGTFELVVQLPDRDKTKALGEKVKSAVVDFIMYIATQKGKEAKAARQAEAASKVAAAMSELHAQVVAPFVPVLPPPSPPAEFVEETSSKASAPESSSFASFVETDDSRRRRRHEHQQRTHALALQRQQARMANIAAAHEKRVREHVMSGLIQQFHVERRLFAHERVGAGAGTPDAPDVIAQKQDRLNLFIESATDVVRLFVMDVSEQSRAQMLKSPDNSGHAYWTRTVTAAFHRSFGEQQKKPFELKCTDRKCKKYNVDTIGIECASGSDLTPPEPLAGEKFASVERLRPYFTRWAAILLCRVANGGLALPAVSSNKNAEVAKAENVRQTMWWLFPELFKQREGSEVTRRTADAYEPAAWSSRTERDEVIEALTIIPSAQLRSNKEAAEAAVSARAQASDAASTQPAESSASASTTSVATSVPDPKSVIDSVSGFNAVAWFGNFIDPAGHAFVMDEASRFTPRTKLKSASFSLTVSITVSFGQAPSFCNAGTIAVRVSGIGTWKKEWIDESGTAVAEPKVKFTPGVAIEVSGALDKVFEVNAIGSTDLSITTTGGKKRVRRGDSSLDVTFVVFVPTAVLDVIDPILGAPSMAASLTTHLKTVVDGISRHLRNEQYKRDVIDAMPGSFSSKETKKTSRVAQAWGAVKAGTRGIGRALKAIYAEHVAKSKDVPSQTANKTLQKLGKVGSLVSSMQSYTVGSTSTLFADLLKAQLSDAAATGRLGVHVVLKWDEKYSALAPSKIELSIVTSVETGGTTGIVGIASTTGNAYSVTIEANEANSMWKTQSTSSAPGDATDRDADAPLEPDEPLPRSTLAPVPPPSDPTPTAPTTRPRSSGPAPPPTRSRSSALSRRRRAFVDQSSRHRHRRRRGSAAALQPEGEE